MAEQITRELIAKSTLEMLQNVLPTNIMANVKNFDVDDDSSYDDGLDEERFFFENIASNLAPTAEQPSPQPVDHNRSLTYFEIVEQEMMQSLPVTKENLEQLTEILEGFDEVNSDLMTRFNLQTTAQLANLLVYALMTGASPNEIENTLFIKPGTVTTVIQTLCEIIVQRKDVFIDWPNKRTMAENVRSFAIYSEFGNYEFFNVFGAIGTTEFQVTPSLQNYLAIPGTNVSSSTYTPIKWQCSCDTNCIIQSSFVVIPSRDVESKNSHVFEMNPIKSAMESMKSDEIYLVSDETLTIFPYLLTPHEKLIINSDSHNKALHSKRKVIDKTFAKIRSRFLILDRLEIRDARTICDLIETIGVLHNLFTIYKDQLYIDESDLLIS